MFSRLFSYFWGCPFLADFLKWCLWCSDSAQIPERHRKNNAGLEKDVVPYSSPRALAFFVILHKSRCDYL